MLSRSYCRSSVTGWVGEQSSWVGVGHTRLQHMMWCRGFSLRAAVYSALTLIQEVWPFVTWLRSNLGMGDVLSLCYVCLCVCARACVYSMCALKRLSFLCVDLWTCWHSIGFLCHAIAEFTIKLASDSRQSMLSLVPLALLLLVNLSSVIHLLQNVAQKDINTHGRLAGIVSDTGATWRLGIHPLHYLPSAPRVFLPEFSPVFSTHKLYLGRAPSYINLHNSICRSIMAFYTFIFFCPWGSSPGVYCQSHMLYRERETLYRGPQPFCLNHCYRSVNSHLVRRWVLQ